MPYAYSLDDYVNEVREYILRNSLVKPLVVAHSFGARIVIKGLYDKKLDFLTRLLYSVRVRKYVNCVGMP